MADENVASSECLPGLPSIDVDDPGLRGGSLPLQEKVVNVSKVSKHNDHVSNANTPADDCF